ncbi:MAG: uracil-DNA glycosylase [Leptospiraceae bacterium]|nr:uracil-DNA glycosylase [Leptospiraceae bacterium]MCK6380054.1 uracil-DNA glycosylase [Leptospiraceae bacterium]NUM40647.1 uracil-DNA glycosylase [Leptospiraceae bacterium]
MIGPPIIGSVQNTKIISIGQAPGIHEKRFMKPFSYTAGKTLFRWLQSIGIEEEDFRNKVNMSAMCRCFPGKEKNGDRKPSRIEIQNCSQYLEFEFKHHKPELVIPIGKLAIDLTMEKNLNYKLKNVVGKKFERTIFGISSDWIPLPHPSGLNVWNHTKEGKELIEKALDLIKNHKSIQEIFFPKHVE